MGFLIELLMRVISLVIICGLIWTCLLKVYGLSKSSLIVPKRWWTRCWVCFILWCIIVCCMVVFGSVVANLASALFSGFVALLMGVRVW